MSGDKQTIGFRADGDLIDKVEAYEERCGHSSQSEAHEELLRIGLREAKSPMLYRIKDHVIEGWYYMAILALVVVVAGHMTTVLSPGNSIMLAAVLLAVGAGLVGMLELTRVLTGQSELGVAVRRGVGR